MREAKFTIGQIVHHLLFDYRGVIFDVDIRFSGSEEWYQSVARSRPPKDQPWYKILVDNAGYETYVAEKNLEISQNIKAIKHPLLRTHFSQMQNGLYVSLIRKN